MKSERKGYGACRRAWCS